MGLFATLAAVAAVTARTDDKGAEWVYVGTRGAGSSDQDSGAQSPQGIYAARFDTRTGRLCAPELRVALQRATWLVSHPRVPVIYTAADAGGGPSAQSNILAFEVDPASGKLTQLNQVGAGGQDATHLVFEATSNTLFVANHGSGDVTALPVRPDGRLGVAASSQKDYGTGPHPRQKMPEPHGLAVDPSHRYVLVSDFGADRIFVYHFDRASRTLTPAQRPYEPVPPGSGPRHLTFTPNGKFVYVLTELTAELRAYRWDAREARLTLHQARTTYPRDYSGQQKSAGEITLSRDGKFLYVSLRGDQDSLVVYTINQDNGEFQEIQRLPALGKVPWSFGIDPTGRWLLVTNEGSNSVSVFNIDRATGRLSATQESLSIPKPISVTFYSRKQ